MTQRASESLVAALIRIGLLLALAIMLMAENAQAQALSSVAGRSRTGNHTSLRLRQRCGRSIQLYGVAVAPPGCTSKETYEV